MSFAIEVSMYATSIFRNKIMWFMQEQGAAICACGVYISIFRLTR